MMKEIYSHARCATAAPGERLLETTREKMKAGIKSRKAAPAHFARRYAAAALCLVFLAAAGLLLPGVWQSGQKGPEMDGDYRPISSGVPGAVSSQGLSHKNAESSGTSSSEDGAILYSDLKLAPITPVTPPEGTGVGSSTACVRAFEEPILEESTFVVKAKVTGTRFEKRLQWDDPDGQTQWNGPVSGSIEVDRDVAIYTLEIEKVYYQKQGYTLSKTMEIVQPLYNATTLFDLVVGLHEGRTYLMPLIVYDQNLTDGLYRGEPTLLYSFSPLVEQTEDGGYLFWSDRLGASEDTPERNVGWPSLVNDQTRPVEFIDGEEAWVGPGVMKYRNDAGFESDFQALIDKYCK